MSYSRYFGMRSFENVVRDGRFRVPSTGTPLKIGSPVQLDGANPGRLKVAGDAAAPGPNCGLVIFEHIQNKSDALTTQYDSPYDQVPLGQYAQMMHGAGVKVWLKHQDDKTLYDGRTQAGGSLLDDAFDFAAAKPGDGLVPGSNGKLRATAAGEDAWLVIEQVNPSNRVVEARFTF